MTRARIPNLRILSAPRGPRKKGSEGRPAPLRPTLDPEVQLARARSSSRRLRLGAARRGLTAAGPLSNLAAHFQEPRNLWRPSGPLTRLNRPQPPIPRLAQLQITLTWIQTLRTSKPFVRAREYLHHLVDEGLEILQSLADKLSLKPVLATAYPLPSRESHTPDTPRQLLSQSLGGDGAVLPTARPVPTLVLIKNTTGSVTEELPAGRIFGSHGAQTGASGPFDPRRNKTTPLVKSTVQILDRIGRIVGQSWMVAGGAEGHVRVRLQEGSEASFDTRQNTKPTHEDAYLYAVVEINNELVEIDVIADGVGGKKGGAMASSAWLSGIHAALQDAVREGRFPLAGDLAREGRRAIEKQREHHDQFDADTTGTVLVRRGAFFTLATGGNSPFYLGRRLASSPSYEIVGYSDSWNIEYPTPGSIPTTLPITRGEPALYWGVLQEGDQWIMGSDGAIQPILGKRFETYGSSFTRLFFGYPYLNQQDLAPLSRLMQGLVTATANGSTLIPAKRILDLVAVNFVAPATGVTVGGINPNFIGGSSPADNLVLGHGKVGRVSLPKGIEVPNGYRPLEKVTGTSSPSSNKGVSLPNQRAAVINGPLSRQVQTVIHTLITGPRIKTQDWYQVELFFDTGSNVLTDVQKGDNIIRLRYHVTGNKDRAVLDPAINWKLIHLASHTTDEQLRGNLYTLATMRTVNLDKTKSPFDPPR